MGIVDEQIKTRTTTPFQQANGQQPGTSSTPSTTSTQTAPPAIGNERQMPAGDHQPAYEDAAHSVPQRTLNGGGIVSSFSSGGAGGAAGGAPGAGDVGKVGDMPGAPTGPAGSTYKPELGAVTADQTVQGQLGGILSAGNPLLEGAKARAQQQANARGLQNSSMAVQSGEEAIVNTALPIAQQDAAAYQKQALVNQDISNQFLSMDKGQALDLEKAYEAFKQNNYMFDKDAALKKYISDTGNSTQEKVAAMQAAAQTASASIGASASMYATDARLKETGMTLEAQALAQQAGFQQQDKITMANFSQQNFQAFSGGMNAINMSEIPPEAKQAAMNSHLSVYAGVPMPITIDMSAFRPITAREQP